MKKSTYQQYLYCFILSILVPYAFWLGYGWNMVTILISRAFKGAVLIRGRHLFQCSHPKERCLLEGGAYLWLDAYQRKYGSYLVRTKVYPLEQRLDHAAVAKNGVRFALMKQILSPVLLPIRHIKINHLFNCSEKCLVYLLTCWVCLKRYVGQTVDEFQNRRNNYKSNDRKSLNRQPCFQEHIFEHFNGDGCHGFLEKNNIFSQN